MFMNNLSNLSNILNMNGYLYNDMRKYDFHFNIIRFIFAFERLDWREIRENNINSNSNSNSYSYS
jgi:hypothetical protein